MNINTNNNNNNIMRSYYSENELKALDYIKKSASEEIPPNQLAMKNYYLNKVTYLNKAINYLNKEKQDLLFETKKYFNVPHQNLRYLARELNYSNGGGKTRRNKKIYKMKTLRQRK